MKKKAIFRALAVASVLLGGAGPVQAQWITQSFNLLPGWNAVYLHVDASYATLRDLVGADTNNPIQEVWLWQPAPTTLQFIDSPQVPTGSSSQWLSWLRTQPLTSPLPRLVPNAAYLVRVDTNITSYTWNLLGKPVPTRYLWTTTGLNFVDFPAREDSPPSFESFLTPAPDLLRNGQFYRYMGGELGPDNPARLFAFRTTPVRRGEAFWVRAADVFNRYFGPFELDLQSLQGVRFHDTLGQYQLRVRNLTASDLTVTLQLQASAAAPAGEPAIVGTPPLLLRGERDLADLTYPYTRLEGGTNSWLLKPKGQVGSEVAVVLGVNRSQMPGSPGDQYAGVLQFADSLYLTRLDIPVSATVASSAGLWVGPVSLSQVRHYLKNYEKDAAGQTVQSTNGQYIVTSTNTNYGMAARSYPLRLIIHSPAGSNSVLLQRVYYGWNQASNMILATQEKLLDPQRLAEAKRISAVHLPWTEANTPWEFSGALTQGTNVTATVALSYDNQASNPFLHTYHPDHDNLNAAFDTALPVGQESYSVVRQITLTVTPPRDEFDSLTSGSQTLTGLYEEAITIQAKGSESRRFDVQGSFSLTRITDIATLSR
jgi:hypothetical protein